MKCLSLGADVCVCVCTHVSQCIQIILKPNFTVCDCEKVAVIAQCHYIVSDFVTLLMDIHSLSGLLQNTMGISFEHQTVKSSISKNSRSFCCTSTLIGIIFATVYWSYTSAPPVQRMDRDSFIFQFYCLVW